MAASPTLQEHKRSLRIEMRGKRQIYAPTHGILMEKLTQLFLGGISLKKHAIIAAYDAFRDEADLSPLIMALQQRGHPIALPVIVGKRQALAFCLYQPNDQMTVNFLGIREPALFDPSRAVDPDIVLLPLLAFDKNRNRLGYGGGYYDRTLTNLRSRKSVFAIGMGYAYQEIPHVPVGPYDEKLDKIVTDVNIF